MKKIIILIGPKGSGKSFIGTIFERNFQIKFLRVEDWAKVVKKDRIFNDEEYLKEVFRVIENGVRESLKQQNSIIFESTGLTIYFDTMLKNLKKDYSVTTIKINADKDLCLKRIQTRDQSIHINISDEQVNMINEKVLEKNILTDFEIDNNTLSKKLEQQIDKIISTIFPSSQK